MEETFENLQVGMYLKLPILLNSEDAVKLIDDKLVKRGEIRGNCNKIPAKFLGQLKVI